MNKRPLLAVVVGLACASPIAPARANILDDKPYVALPQCPNVRQNVQIANEYLQKVKRKNDVRDVPGLIDRLTALGNAYHHCAVGYDATRITEPEKADAAQHHIAAEAALVYTHAASALGVLIENMPKAKRKSLEDIFVETAHLAVVDGKYVLDRSDDELDKRHAKLVVDGMKRAARRMLPKRYDEIVEIRPEDVREH
jgi:hypothetical protein